MEVSDTVRREASLTNKVQRNILYKENRTIWVWEENLDEVFKQKIGSFLRSVLYNEGWE